jgi:transcriptional regulator
MVAMSRWFRRFAERQAERIPSPNEGLHRDPQARRMRRNPDYALEADEALRDLIRSSPWATIVTAVPGRGAVASHYPVLLDEEADGVVLLSHVGRPDERLHELGGHELLVILQGPHGYVSPSWYGAGPAVPTWNFAVAHAYGTPELLDADENLAVLDRLVDRFEGAVSEPARLLANAANAEYAERIVHGTVGFRLRVTRWEGKEKMSQDKPAEVVDRIIAALSAEGPYANAGLAERMRRVHGR